MSRLLLYYAGMADDGVKEQIGLAVSVDGRHFEKANGTGLVLARDEAVEWRSLRVCNPTVIADDGGYTMYYQGIANGGETGQTHTSIGIARSSDGIRWTPDPAPIVSWRAMAEHDSGFDERNRVDVLEPAVLHRPDGRCMWFVYRHRSTPGNALFYAEEDPAGSWRVRRRVPLGAAVSGLDVHYPQIVEEGDALVLYLTLRDRRLLHAIVRMRSRDGLEWSAPETILPTRRPLEPSLYLRVLWHLPQGVRHRVLSGRQALGFAHPHVVRDGGTRLYYHRANFGPRGLWYDIASCEFDRGRCRGHRTVLEPARDPNAWDAFFVADPFVVVDPAS